MIFQGKYKLKALIDDKELLEEKYLQFASKLTQSRSKISKDFSKQVEKKYSFVKYT